MGKKVYQKPEWHFVGCKIDKTLDWESMSQEELEREFEKNGYKEGKVLYQLNPQYLSRNIAGETILVPTGEAAVKFNGLANLNKTSTFLWEYLKDKRTLWDMIFAFAEEYELSIEQSKADVADFLAIATENELVLKS